MEEEEKDVLEDEPQFEMTPEQATGQKPLMFNRKRVLVVICISLSVVVGGGLLLNISRPKKNSSAQENEYSSANTSADFLASLRDRAVRSNRTQAQEPPPEEAPAPEPQFEQEPLLPPASFGRPSAQSPPAQAPPPQPPAQYPQAQAPPQQQGDPTHFRSSLVPQVQGSLFQGGQERQPAPAQNRSPADDYYDYLASQYAARPASGASGNGTGGQAQNTAQNSQDNRQSFYESSSSTGAAGGYFLGENSVWAGSMIPGVLETAINTDLPGNVRARVTQNVYDSKTGRVLLIPQGTILLARYNSSVSYAQSRVQIVWDTLIRPDGFLVELEGAPGVDSAGMSGQAARYSENWFEYIKAAGIITLFSIANARLVETSAKYASESAAGNVAEGNSQFINQLGGNLVSRAMNIQPTLTVDSGTAVNIMLNKTLYLPPAAGYPASQKYILE